MEEISKVDAAHGVIVQTHNALCCWPIFTYGTEEQKQKYLPNLLSGKHLGAFGLTEPNAGTDAAGTQTKARLDLSLIHISLSIAVTAVVLLIALFVLKTIARKTSKADTAAAA